MKKYGRPYTSNAVTGNGAQPCFGEINLCGQTGNQVDLGKYGTCLCTFWKMIRLSENYKLHNVIRKNSTIHLIDKYYDFFYLYKKEA